MKRTGLDGVLNGVLASVLAAPHGFDLREVSAPAAGPRDTPIRFTRAGARRDDVRGLNGHHAAGGGRCSPVGPCRAETLRA